MQFQANSEPSASVLIDTRTDVRRDCFSRVFVRPTGVETPSRPVSFVVDSVPERAHAAPAGRRVWCFDRDSGSTCKPIVLLEKCCRLAVEWGSRLQRWIRLSAAWIQGPRGM